MDISITDLLVKPERRPDQPKANAASAVALNGLLGQFSDMMRQATGGDAFARPSTREPVSESRTGTRATSETAAETVRDDTGRRADAADTTGARSSHGDDGTPRSTGKDEPPEPALRDIDRKDGERKAAAEGAETETEIPAAAGAENAADGIEIAAEASAAIIPAGILDVPGKASGLDIMAIAQPGTSANLNSGTALSTAAVSNPATGAEGKVDTTAAGGPSPSLAANPASEIVTNAPRAEAADKGMSAALASLANFATNAKGAGAAEQALATLTVPANPKSALADGPGQAAISITVTEETPNPVSKPSAMLLATGPAADNASVAVAKTPAGGTAQVGGQQGANPSTVGQTAPDAAALANNGAATQIPGGAATAGLNATAAASYGVTQSTANTGGLTMDSAVPVAPVGGMGSAQASPVQALSAATRPTPPAQPVIDQLAVHIAKAAAEGMDKISIRLRPAALGHIEIQLELSHDGRIVAVVTAEKSETLELLQRDARGLERALQEAGLRTNSDSLSFNLRGEGSDGGREIPDHAAAANGTPVEAETLADVSVAEMAGYANARAALGGVDIRV